MAIYDVQMSALAYVNGSLMVRADTEEEAEQKALSNPGDVVWNYAGLSENHPPEICCVEEI